MLKIAWLSRLKAKFFYYPTKAQMHTQFLLCASCLLTSVSAVAFSNTAIEAHTTEVIADQLQSPWSMVELPDGTFLITERDGHVVVVKDKKQSRTRLNLDGLYVAGQGGLLDIVLAPDFEETNALYVTYAQGELRANRLVVAKLTFDGSKFSQPEVVFKVATDKDTPQHYAGRTLILNDNTMLITSGDGFDYREQAQVKSSQLGKILRIKLDGGIPKDNPFIADNSTNAHAVYSMGHRNPQGLVYDYDNQQIVSHEHGPAGGDELNILQPGKNYGWPVITYGKDYSQARISPFTEYPSMMQPEVDWTPSIAPSGMAYYGSKANAFKSLQGHVLITTLVDKTLYAVDLNNDYRQSAIFNDVTGRLRDVIVSRAGNVVVLTDGKDAKLLLIKPKQS